MAQVPSNLIPTRISQLPVDPSPSGQVWLFVNNGGVSYRVQAYELIAATSVPNTRQVIAGTGLQGGGALSSDVTLGIAPGGVGATQLSDSGASAGAYGSVTQGVVLTVDAKGRITECSQVTLTPDFSSLTSKPTTLVGYGITDAQPLDATLTAMAGVTTAADRLTYFTGVDAAAVTTFTAFARSLLDDVDAAAARSTLGAQTSDATLTALAGVTSAADTLPYFTGVDSASVTGLTPFARTLLDDTTASAMKTTLGLDTISGGVF